MTQEQEGHDPLGPFQRAFEIPGDPTFPSEFPSVEITSALPTWRDKAEKGELGNCAFVDLADPRFMHTFDGSSWTVKAMSEVPKFTDPTSVDGLLIKSGHFRGSRENIFQILDRMAPHMRHGTPVVIHEPTDDQEEKIVGQREGTLREHGFELVQMHSGNNVLVWEGIRINNHAELQLILQEKPMIPRALRESLLAQQLPQGRIVNINTDHPHAARILDRKNWEPVLERGEEIHIDPNKRDRRKIAGIVVEIPNGLKKGNFPEALVARAGSMIRRTADIDERGTVKDEHLGAVFTVWPKGDYVPTKTELEKIFKNAGLTVDHSETWLYPAELADGSTVMVAQARTHKFPRVPEFVRQGIRGEVKVVHQPGDVKKLPERTCADCGEHSVEARYEERFWKKKGAQILVEEIICNSGKHSGGIPLVLENHFNRFLTSPENDSGRTTPQRQLSRAHQG